PPTPRVRGWRAAPKQEGGPGERLLRRGPRRATVGSGRPSAEAAAAGPGLSPAEIGRLRSRQARRRRPAGARVAPCGVRPWEASFRGGTRSPTRAHCIPARRRQESPGPEKPDIFLQKGTQVERRIWPVPFAARRDRPGLRSGTAHHAGGPHMKDSDQVERLSRIQTHWATIVRAARGQGEDQQGLQRLLVRY